MSGASLLMLVGTVISLAMSLDFIRPVRRTSPF